jgi:hypothetical protein
VNRVVRSTSGLGVGALMATMALAGMAGSQKPPGWDREPLDLRGFCRAQYGPSADAFQPPDVDSWRCGVTRNGVWGLEPVDLDAVCAWQNGDDAQLDEITATDGDVKGQVLCKM